MLTLIRLWQDYVESFEPQPSVNHDKYPSTL
jgi:hypothetical protein